MSVNSKAWADGIISDIRRVRDASVGMSAADANRVIRALTDALDRRDPDAIKLARKLGDMNVVFAKRAA